MYSVDGTQSNDYILNFNREDTTKLFSLDFNGYKYIDEVAFESEKYDYEIDVFQYTDLVPSFIKFDPDSTVRFEGLDSIKKGINNVKVIVEKRDVATTIYDVKINVSYSIDFSYKGRVQEFIAPHTGLYKLEAWGASGGTRVSTVLGGAGGFSSGVVSLEKGESLYIFVGGEGNQLSKGFNGGGKSDHNGNATYGGGATDFRVGGKGYFNRILVAGGGGTASTTYPGGLAGGSIRDNRSW